MGGFLRSDVFHTFVAQGKHVDTGEQIFPRAQQNRGDGQMYLVDQSGAQIFADRRAAAEPDVLTVGCSAGALQCAVYPVGDEMECGAAVHRDRLAGMVGQHEYRGVVRRGVAPPALPVFIGPGAADRAEHVAAQDPCADVAESARGKVVIDAGRTIPVAVHALEGAGGEKPFVQRHAADAKRIFQALIRPGTVSVK